MLFTFFTVLTFATVFEKAMWVKLHLSTYQGSGLNHDIYYLPQTHGGGGTGFI